MNSHVYTYPTLTSFSTSSFLNQKFKCFAVSFDTRFSSEENKSCFPDETRQGILQWTAFPWFYQRLLIRYLFLSLLFLHFLLISIKHTLFSLILCNQNNNSVFFKKAYIIYISYLFYPKKYLAHFFSPVTSFKTLGDDVKHKS